MSQIGTMQLQPSSVFNIPFDTYEKDFTFVVNGEKIKTSRLISDLLSPVICRMHLNDPTVDTFTIDTQKTGNFSLILDLVKFQEIRISTNEIEFISEVIEILGNEHIKCSEKPESSEPTIENVFSQINFHERYKLFYSNRFQTEIEFIASHFPELCSEHEEEFSSLSNDTIMRIIKDDHFKLNSEDEFLQFVNKLYIRDSRFSDLYEEVIFTNVTSAAMTEFVKVYKPNDLTFSIWSSLTKRLEREIVFDKEHEEPNDRYINKKPFNLGQLFSHTNGNEFQGIIRHLLNESNGNIESEVNITSSSIYSSDYKPQNVTLFDKNDHFISDNRPNSYLCFDFKDRRVIPSDVTIKTRNGGTNDNQPRSWVIEGSNDNNTWDILDKQEDSPHLHGGNLVHTFTLNNQNSKEYKFIRMRNTGLDWSNNNYLIVCSFEIYGRLI